MDLQFAINEGHCLSREYFNTGLRKFYGDMPETFNGPFSKYTIAIVSATMKHEVADELKQQFILSEALVVLEKSVKL